MCLQMLGAGKDAEVKRGLVWLDQINCKWDDAWGAAPLYYWYYITQARFHAGGMAWNKWNRQFSDELVKNQVVLKATRTDERDAGYWELPTKGGKIIRDHSTGLVYNTCLCTLMLETYYRYVPFGAKP